MTYIFHRIIYRVFSFLHLNFLVEKERDSNYLKLSMNVWERFLIRLVVYLFYGLLIAMASMWVFSEVLWMKALGIFMAIFLLDRLRYFKRESTSVWSILEYSLDRTTLFGGDFYLWAAEKSLGYDEVKELLSLKKSAYKKVKKEIKEKLNTTLGAKTSKKDLLDFIKGLLKDGVSVSPDILFSRLMENSKNVKIIIDNALASS